MCAQVDSEGYVHNMMETVMEYNKDASAIDKEEMYIKTKSGQRRTRKENFGM